jgi:hypothetical protein
MHLQSTPYNTSTPCAVEASRREGVKASRDQGIKVCDVSRHCLILPYGVPDG